MSAFSNNPQSAQNAIDACNSAHTGLYQAIGQLKQGSVIRAKSLISHFYCSFG